MGDPTKVLILAPTTTTHKFSGEQFQFASANGSAGLAAIQALYESNNGPITAMSST